MREPYRPLLIVHVVWHPLCASAEMIAEELLATLFEDHRDLTVHGLRIPVRLWSGFGGELHAPPPAPIRTDDAERTVVVVLVDDEFLAADGWPEHLAELASASDQDRLHFLPVALSPHALRLSGPAAAYNWVRAYQRMDDTRQAFVVNSIVHGLLELLTADTLTVFLSHAKLDGEPVAERVGSFLQRSTKVDNWFSRHDIPHGSRWADEIRGAARRNLLLVVRSDAYATRQWCRIEVLEAKAAGSPVVVLDVLESGEDRSFPYLGNGPVVRWSPDPTPAMQEHLLTVILLEALRFEYFPLRVGGLCRLRGVPQPRYILPRPPELLGLLSVLEARVDDAGSMIYPDPPLGTEELELVGRLLPGLVPTTPTALLSGG